MQALRALCNARKQRAVRRLIREGIEPVAGHGGDGGSGVRDTNSEQDNATYVVARLKRDDPALAQQVIDGKISANAAAAYDAGMSMRAIADVTFLHRATIRKMISEVGLL